MLKTHFPTAKLSHKVKLKCFCFFCFFCQLVLIKIILFRNFRKVACAELSLECSSSAASSATLSPAETPKKDKKGARPKSLPVTVANNNNNVVVKSPADSSVEPDKDHHIHRYYSFLRSQHTSRKR